MGRTMSGPKPLSAALIAIVLAATAHAQKLLDSDAPINWTSPFANPAPAGPLRFLGDFTRFLTPPEGEWASSNLLADPDELLADAFAVQRPVRDDWIGPSTLANQIATRSPADSFPPGHGGDGAPGLRRSGLQHVATAKTEVDQFALSSSWTLREHDDPLDPAFKGAWETGESLKMPVAGPLFAFAQLDASSSTVEQQQYKWLGKYGVGLKLKPWLAPEVQVRGGPAVRYDDTGKPLRGNSAERSELFMEAVTKVGLPVIGPLNVEYTSYAIPAATATEHNTINQDLRVARPLIGGGELHFGAKYRWEDTAAGAAPWVDRMQLYLGVQLKR